MNNQNPQSHNLNWRAHSFMEDARNQGVPRADNFYGHYPGPHYVDEYIDHGYVYPDIMAAYQPAEYPTPPSNPGSYNAFGLMTPQAYTKYYHKIETYLLLNGNYDMKGYENPSNLFGQTPLLRDLNLFPAVGHPQQHHPIAMRNSYPVEQLGRIKQTEKGMDLIVIESDQQKVDVGGRKRYVQSQQGHFIDNRKREAPLGKLMLPLQQSQKQQPAILSGQPPNGGRPLHDQGKAFRPASPQTILPIAQVAHIIPLAKIKQLQQQILEQLQNASLPDNMMKLFLKYKTIQTGSKYQQNQQMPIKIMNLLKIYRAIIWFQKQRKLVMENKFAGHLLADFNITNQNHIAPNNTCSKAQTIQINQNNKLCTDSRTFHVNTHHQAQIAKQLLYRKQFTPPDFIAKKKKITKKQQFCHNSQEFSFYGKGKITQKFEAQDQRNQISQRKLRQRRKKRNKKQKASTFQERGSKQKISSQKQKSKKEMEQQEKLKKIQNQKSHNKIQLSNEDQVYIQKIERWAQKTLASAIKQKKSKSLQKVKPISGSQNSHKSDPFRVIKSSQSGRSRKNRQRSTKASQHAFRQVLLQKITDSKQSRNVAIPNLINFSTSNDLSLAQKQQYQKELLHLQKQLRNNESHGKIRSGKQYYQAKMPGFIISQRELDEVIRQKRQQLVQRRMNVLSF